MQRSIGTFILIFFFFAVTPQGVSHESANSTNSTNSTSSANSTNVNWETENDDNSHVCDEGFFHIHCPGEFCEEDEEALEEDEQCIACCLCDEDDRANAVCPECEDWPQSCAGDSFYAHFSTSDCREEPYSISEFNMPQFDECNVVEDESWMFQCIDSESYRMFQYSGKNCTGRISSDMRIVRGSCAPDFTGVVSSFGMWIFPDLQCDNDFLDVECGAFNSGYQCAPSVQEHHLEAVHSPSCIDACESLGYAGCCQWESDIQQCLFRPITEIVNQNAIDGGSVSSSLCDSKRPVAVLPEEEDRSFNYFLVFGIVALIFTIAVLVLIMCRYLHKQKVEECNQDDQEDTFSESIFVSPDAEPSVLLTRQMHHLKMAEDIEERLRLQESTHRTSPLPAPSNTSTNTMSMALKVPFPDPLSAHIIDEINSETTGNTLSSTDLNLGTSKSEHASSPRNSPDHSSSPTSADIKLVSTTAPSTFSESSDCVTLASSILDPDFQLHETSLGKIPSKLKTEAGGMACSICLEAIQVGERMRVLTCGHEFHATCIQAWLKNNVQCPFCRAEQPRHTRKNSNFI